MAVVTAVTPEKKGAKMTNREFVFTELVIIGHEMAYGPVPETCEEHKVDLLELRRGASQAAPETQYNPIKQFEKGLKVLERYGVLKITDVFSTFYTIAFVNDQDKWRKYFDDIPAKHRKR